MNRLQVHQVRPVSGFKRKNSLPWSPQGRTCLAPWLWVPPAPANAAPGHCGNNCPQVPPQCSSHGRKLSDQTTSVELVQPPTHTQKPRQNTLHGPHRNTPAWLLGCGPLLSQQVQHLDAEEGELTVLDELTQVSKASLTCVRDLLRKVTASPERTKSFHTAEQAAATLQPHCSNGCVCAAVGAGRVGRITWSRGHLACKCSHGQPPGRHSIMQ